MGRFEPFSSHRRETLNIAAILRDPDENPMKNVASTELITDYLTALRNHAEMVLAYTFQTGAFLSTPIEYVLTVPAGWTEAEEAETQLCGENAGIGTGSAIQLISEPEAAVMYAFNAMDPNI